MTKNTEEMNNVKKTIEAHKEFSEDKALEKAGKAEEVTEDMIESEIVKEIIEEEKEKKELIKVIEEKGKLEVIDTSRMRRGESFL